jgi:hypothetical protein
LINDQGDEDSDELKKIKSIEFIKKRKRLYELTSENSVKLFKHYPNVYISQSEDQENNQKDDIS